VNDLRFPLAKSTPAQSCDPGVRAQTEQNYLTNARPQVREILIAKKMAHWWVVAKCRLIDPTCPTWRARKNYQRLCASTRKLCKGSGSMNFQRFECRPAKVLIICALRAAGTAPVPLPGVQRKSLFFNS
jgi:hypothetical protein